MVALVAACLGQALAPDTLDGVSGSVAPIGNPLGVMALRPAVGPVTAVSALVLVVYGLAALGDLARRALRGTEADRRQLRWIVASLALLPFGVGLAAALSSAGWSSAGDVALSVSQLTAIVGAALSLALGVLRDGMFELREYARRLTLGAVLSAVIVVGFVALVSLVAGLTSASGAVPPAVAAAVVAVALGPLRGRLQRGVERLLYGWRSEPFRVLGDLGTRLEATTTAESALQAVTDTVVSGLRLPYARIDLELDRQGATTVAATGHGVDDVVTFDLVDGDGRLGVLVVGRRSSEEAFRPDELELLRSLARQTATAARATLLTTQLRAARAGLIRSREEERRRLRRELHDGVGPALAGLGLQLDAAYDLARTSPADAGELLDSMRRSLRDTAAEVRRIVHDLRPGILDELGLLGAVREQAQFLAAGSSGSLDVILDLPAQADLPAAVEVAVYRIASEALTNVVRHAKAHTCEITLSVNGQVELDIVDDGIGFAPDEQPPSGVGLVSMHDRAVELGGSVTVTPRQPHGTCVRLRLPVPT